MAENKSGAKLCSRNNSVYKTFFALLVCSQGLSDPLCPRVIGLSPCFYPVQHGRKLLQIIAIPEIYHADMYFTI